MPGHIPWPKSLIGTAQLARAFRESGLPVVLVNVTAGAPGRTDAGPRQAAFTEDWTELVPELEPQASDYIVSKQRLGAFIGTGLRQILARAGRDADFPGRSVDKHRVESTARSAYDHGYNVVLVVDAMTDRDAEAHRQSVEKIFPRLGETDTTENVLKMLKHTPALLARQTSRIVKIVRRTQRILKKTVLERQSQAFCGDKASCSAVY